MGVPERWHTVELLQEWNKRKVLGRSVFGEAPGWAGQGCAPNSQSWADFCLWLLSSHHPGWPVSQLHTLAPWLQGGLWVSPWAPLCSMTWPAHSPADKIPSCSLYLCCVYCCGSTMFSVCVLCLWLCVCVHTMYVYCVLVCTEPRGQCLPSSTSLTLFLEPDLWVWSSLIWPDRLARMLWGSAISSISVPPTLRLQVSFAPSLLCGAEDPNSHRYAYASNTLPTEPLASLP